jgi:hypothetical protein
MNASVTLMWSSDSWYSENKEANAIERLGEHWLSSTVFLNIYSMGRLKNIFVLKKIVFLRGN